MDKKALAVGIFGGLGLGILIGSELSGYIRMNVLGGLIPLFHIFL